MQIRLKYILLAFLLLENLAKCNQEINMTVEFLLCDQVSEIFLNFYSFFLKISISTISGWVGGWKKKNFPMLFFMPVTRNL